MASAYSQAKQVETDAMPNTTEEVFVFPMSFAQERLWFLDQFEPESAFYNIPVALGLAGGVNRAALQTSLQQIMKRHEVLRTTFAVLEGQPVQVIHEALPLPLPYRDLSQLSEAERTEELGRLAREQAQTPFDLGRGPLLRALLVQVEAGQHQLLLTLHHIVSDGWSMGLLFEELGRLYEAAVQGREAELPALPIQYADFAQWQRERLAGAELERLLQYWRGQLAGAPAVLELPLDHGRPALQSYRGATQLFEVAEETTQALKRLSQEAGVTLFMTLLAAFKTLLYRYTGQRDVVVGTPIANRNRGELEGLIGFFVNTLVLRTDLGGEPSFRELLKRVRKVTLEAYEHQDLPFEKLVEELQPERHLNHSPLFQVLFSLQNNPTPTSSGEGSKASLKDLENTPKLGTSKFDLALFTEEAEHTILVGLEYNTDLFEAGTIDRMASHFQTLLTSIIANPDERISSLEMLRLAEREKILHAWNATDAAYQAQATLHQLFEAQVTRSPDVAAVTMGETTWTYEELNQRANQLAHYLTRSGVKSNARVGVCLKRSLDLILGMLAILKAGAAYVPLDPQYPRERLSFMISDADASFVISDERLAGELPAEDLTIIYLDRDAKEIAQENTENPALIGSANSLAYVIYTSGSTGIPKGVAMAHQPIVNLLSWQNRNSQFPPGMKTLQFASPSFDVSIQEIFSTWLTSGTLIVIPEAERQDVTKWLKVVEESKIERLFLPPVVLQQMAEALEEKTVLPGLRQIITAGEQLQITEAVVHLFERLNDCSLHNHYGPSESHVATEYVLRGNPNDWPALPPIGTPIANTQIYLLDEHMQPVFIGVPGELYIGGVALAQGYLARPELTAERFLPNPFSKKPGERIYRTGDLARYRADGAIEYLGRIDQQVKLRGFRVELGDVEAVLLRHPAVKEAVAMISAESPGDQRLIVYIVPVNGTLPSTPQLQRFLKQTLPEYMIPSSFIPLDSIPLTSNGKVDRRRLPALDKKRPELEHGFIAPRSAIEEQLAEIWASVLKLERVGIFDNFFELGGHSLLATQVISRVRHTLQVEIPLRDLFESPTISEMALGVAGQRIKDKDP